MSAGLLIDVQLDRPGGEDLAAHLRERVELAVLGVLTELGDGEREHLRVTSTIVDRDGVETELTAAALTPPRAAGPGGAPSPARHPPARQAGRHRPPPANEDPGVRMSRMV